MLLLLWDTAGDDVSNVTRLRSKSVRCFLDMDSFNEMFIFSFI